MKTIFFLLLLNWTIQVPAQEPVFEEYFPLKAGAVQKYAVRHIIEGDTLADKNEIKICRSQIVKGKTVYYLSDDLKEKKEDNPIIGSEAFANGIFYYEKGKFMFSPVFWKDDIKKANLDYFEPLFPKTITIDSVYKYKHDEETRKYRFTGFESIVIRGKMNNDCLKLIVEQDWPTAKYTDTVWFRKNIGVVKWLRSTGRLEELIR